MGMSASKADEDTVRYEEKTRTSSPGSSPSGDEHADVHHATRKSSAAPSAAALLRNPLTGMTEEDVIADVDEFIDSKGLAEHREVFRKGALLARVNGRDDGFEELNIGPEQVWMRGLLNGAPYLCSCVLGCWTNAPLNKLFGRRGTIFISCFISFATGFWMAAADSWYNLLIARFALGFAVGAKSSTTPVYAAECAPKVIRGALTMMWQMWTAFGIMLGFVASVAFQDCDFLGQYSQWRWMLGSTAIPPFFVMVQV